MKKKLLTIGLICLLLPINARALEGSIIINCNKTTLFVGETALCTISGKSGEEVSAISAYLTSSKNIIIDNITTSSIWQGDGLSGSIELYTDTNKKGTFSIASFSVSSNSVGSGKIYINNGIFSDAYFNNFSVLANPVTVTFKEVKTTEKTETNVRNVKQNTVTNKNNISSLNVKSSDATLKELRINGDNVNVDKDEIKYNVLNSVEKVTIEAVANNTSSTIEAPNDITLKVGENSILIRVTAEDGSIKDYSIEIIREERVLSSNNNLNNLLIKGFNIDFSSDKSNYDLGNINTSKLDISYESEDENANIEIIGNNNLGEKDAIVIRVIAENGSIKDYIVTVNNVNTSNMNRKNVILLIVLFFSLIFNLAYIFRTIVGMKKTVK